MKRWARQASTKAWRPAPATAPPARAAAMDASRRGISQPIASYAGSAGQRLHLLRQAIARAAHGLDHAGALHRVERLAQALDVDVDGALLDEHMVAPHTVEQLRAAVHALRMRHEEMQQAEL